MESLSGIHHFYLGMLISLLGFFALWAPKNWMAAFGVALIVVGMTIMADDALQHAVERFSRTNYESPLKVLFSKTLWRFEWVRSLTRFCDGLLGK